MFSWLGEGEGRLYTAGCFTKEVASGYFYTSTASWEADKRGILMFRALSSPRLQELSYAFIGQLWPAQQVMFLSHGQSGLCTRQESFSTTPNDTPQKKETIAEIRARIFDEHVGDGRKSGRKVLLKRLKGKLVADWYAMLRPALPLLEDEQEAG